ncbi:DNA-methyltransferase [Duganella sp. LjRoot269]|uniref:DNA-methyltransferase n=1 Tax=Duganella sp. LjRoot269 TaxID=3342305 RepID=UPI003ED0BB52
MKRDFISGDKVSGSIYFGDCRGSLRAMAAAGVKVQTCVTSPPYYGLRDYGHAGQRGHEATPEEFIAALVEDFRCVRDVLTDDGTLWINIGDSYASKPNGPAGAAGHKGDAPHVAVRKAHARRSSSIPPGLKHKDLIGIPWMLAFALRADGWYLRQDIVWHKPNPMPESVTDRCTKAHEYVFLLSKSPRYFYDAEAVKEPAVYAGSGRESKKRGEFNDKGQASGREPFRAITETRNRRSVWTIATKPYKGAHFAVFPSALVDPCILAGTSAKGHCPLCFARWERQVERTAMVVRKTERNKDRGTRTGTSGTMVSPASAITTGWAPTCACGVDAAPDAVLDPFMGSGTTAAVAIEHGRRFIGCELNCSYLPLQEKRISEAYLQRPTMTKRKILKPAFAVGNPKPQAELFGHLGKEAA